MGFCTLGAYTVLNLFRDFEEDREMDQRIFEFYGSANNRDGLAVRAAAAGLDQRKEENKILILLSDGRPNDIMTGTQNPGYKRALLPGLRPSGYCRGDPKAEKPEDRCAGRLCRRRGGPGRREENLREGLCLYPGSFQLCQCSGPLPEKADPVRLSPFCSAETQAGYSQTYKGYGHGYGDQREQVYG